MSATTPKLDSIVVTAIEIESAEERAAYITEACGGDATLQSEVERLVQAHFQAGSFLERTGPTDPLETLPPEEAMPEAGPRFGGYELLEQIGRGGMGVVYRARQVALNRLVAVKMILAGTHAREEDRQRFLREAEAVARVQHPNVIQIHEVGSQGGNAFLVLEYIDGPTLAEYCASTPQNPRWAAEVVQVLAKAVHHVHEKGVVHRDLKPGNVMLAGGTTPKVLDFGLARQVEVGQGHTHTGAVVGTPSFMAPEQARGETKKVGTPADVWALGAILYNLLTGRPPFLAATTFDTLQQVVGTEPVPVRQLQPTVPRDLETICDRCLQKEPGKRYASAAALAEELARFGRGEPVLARPLGRLQRGWRWCRRNPAVASLLAVTALVLVTGTAVSTAFALSADTEREKAEANATKEKEAREEVERSENRLKQALAEVTVKEQLAQLATQNEAKARRGETAKRKEAERILQASRLSLALSHWEEGNGDAAREKLDELLAIRLDDEQEPQDTWEYRFLDTTMNHHAQRTFRGHTSGPTCVAYSPDGKRLASVGRTTAGNISAQVTVWDVATGRELLLFGGNTNAITCVAFSLDGKRIATGGGGNGKPGEVKLWDAATGKELHALKGHTELVQCLAFSPDGKRLASGSNDWSVKLWDPATGKEVRTILPGEDRNSIFVMGVAFSPDSKHVAAIGDPDTVTLWDAATGKEVWITEGKGLEPRKRGLFGVAISPDGKRLAAGSENGSIKVWDARTGTPLPAIKGHLRKVRSVAFSPDGILLASGSDDGTVRVWLAASGQQLQSFQGGGASLAFSPDGRQLASTGRDDTVKLWDVTVVQGGHILQGHRGVVSSLAFSPDGKRLASADAPGRTPGEIKVWDVVTWQNLLTLKGHIGDVNSVAFSHDGKRLAAGIGNVGDPGELKVIDAATGVQLHSLKGHTREVAKVAFSSDGKYLASASHDQTVKLWDPETGKEIRTLKGHTSFVTCVAFRPDGNQLATGSSDGMVKLWEAASGHELRTLHGHTNVVIGVAYSPDGKRLASGGEDRTVRIWDTATGQDLLTLRGHFQGVVGVAFSPDGRRLASGSMDGTMRLWDAATGQDLLLFKEYSGWVTSVAFTPDGRYLASAIGNGMVKVREATRHQGATLLTGHNARVRIVAYSPDGKRLASGSADSTVKIWDANTGKDLLTLQGHVHEVVGVAFTANGRRLVSDEPSGKQITWDLETGKRIDGPVEKTIPGSPRSPDGRSIAVAGGKLIHLHRLPDGKETVQEGWRWWIDPAPWWHARLASASEGSREWFAAAFHLSRLLLDHPDNEKLRLRHEAALQKHRAATPSDQ